MTSKDPSGVDIEVLPIGAEVEFYASPPWDINKDYTVDMFDFAILGARIGETVSSSYLPRPNPDVNGDLKVDIFDFVKVAVNFGRRYDPSKPPAGAPPKFRNDWRELDYSRYLSLLTMISKELDSLTFSDDEIESTRMLIRELLSLAKDGKFNIERSQLLQNYPNPFNPDTWIPFQLIEGGNVVIRIYDVEGKLVRRFDLGYKPAGVYTSKSSACYWDGLNEFGENVASGVYFYSITSSKFSDIKKMVITK